MPKFISYSAKILKDEQVCKFSRFNFVIDFELELFARKLARKNLTQQFKWTLITRTIRFMGPAKRSDAMMGTVSGDQWSVRKKLIGVVNQNKVLVELNELYLNFYP